MKPNGTNPHAAYNAAMRKWLDAQDHTLFWGTGARTSTVIGTLHTVLELPPLEPWPDAGEPLLIVSFVNKPAGTIYTEFFNLN